MVSPEAIEKAVDEVFDKGFLPQTADLAEFIKATVKHEYEVIYGQHVPDPAATAPFADATVLTGAYATDLIVDHVSTMKILEAAAGWVLIEVGQLGKYQVPIKLFHEVANKVPVVPEYEGPEPIGNAVANVMANVGMNVVTFDEEGPKYVGVDPAAGPIAEMKPKKMVLTFKKPHASKY